jgi:hypothetical protein
MIDDKIRHMIVFVDKGSLKMVYDRIVKTIIPTA